MLQTGILYKFIGKQRDTTTTLVIKYCKKILSTEIARGSHLVRLERRNVRLERRNYD